MSEIIVQKANEKELSLWDKFIDNTTNGTLMHKIKFLTYHVNKLDKNSIFLFFIKGSEPIALMSLAFFEEDEKKAKSPYGAIFGGIVCKKKPSLSTSLQLISRLKE